MVDPIDFPLERLLNIQQPCTVGLETILYAGASEVDAADFRAPSIWKEPELQDWQPAELSEHRAYIAYVEYETIYQWARLEAVDLSRLPLRWLWNRMEAYRLKMVFPIFDGVKERTIFSFRAGQLWEYPCE